jgi:hypothetical protein
MRLTAADAAPRHSKGPRYTLVRPSAQCVSPGTNPDSGRLDDVLHGSSSRRRSSTSCRPSPPLPTNPAHTVPEIAAAPCAHAESVVRGRGRRPNESPRLGYSAPVAAHVAECCQRTRYPHRVRRRSAFIPSTGFEPVIGQLQGRRPQNGDRTKTGGGRSTVSTTLAAEPRHAERLSVRRRGCQGVHPSRTTGTR